MRGYYGIALWEPKIQHNLGTILRSAHCFGANFVCTIGNRYRRQSTDTSRASKHVPLFHYEDWEDFKKHMPEKTPIIALEVDGKRNLNNFCHPERAIYLFGGEDRTLPENLINKEFTVKIPTAHCLNLASAASIVIYDRIRSWEKNK